MTHFFRRAVVLAILAVGALVTAVPALAQDSLTPSPVNVTLQPGASTTVNKTLHLEALPGAADIIIAIDTTGSMGGAIAQAQAEATQMVTDIQAQIPGARFAVVDFKDYPVAPYVQAGDFPYLLRTAAGYTASATVVQAAINTMAAGGGSDLPESYNAVFRNAVSDPVLVATRNPSAAQFLVVLGDAPPHDAQLGASFSACGNQPPDDADDPTATRIANLAAANIGLLMIFYDTGSFAGTTLACYEQLAAAAGGDAVSGGGGTTLSSQIIAAVQAQASQINSLNLTATNAAGTGPCALNVAFDLSSVSLPQTAPVNFTFTETITAPNTLAAGAYQCVVTATVNGTVRATQTINATVLDGTNPTCVVEVLAASFIRVRVRDLESGIGPGGVTVIAPTTNVTVNNPTTQPGFPAAGTTGDVYITATRINRTVAAVLRLRVQDIGGNFVFCDPVLATLRLKSSARPTVRTYGGIPFVEHKLTIRALKRGLTRAVVSANGRSIRINLRGKAQTSASIASLLSHGRNNKVTIKLYGKRGALALVALTD